MQEAMEALKPFSSTVPRGALEWMKTHWDAAEPLLLARFPDMDEDMRVDFRVDLARAQGYLGFREEALAEVEALIAEAPDKAGGYVLLAEMRGEEAMEFNMPLDVPRAIACLETALRRAGDAEDYAVKERLRDLKEWHRSMQEPM